MHSIWWQNKVSFVPHEKNSTTHLILMDIAQPYWTFSSYFSFDFQKIINYRYLQPKDLNLSLQNLYHQLWMALLVRSTDTEVTVWLAPLMEMEVMVWPPLTETEVTVWWYNNRLLLLRDIRSLQGCPVMAIILTILIGPVHNCNIQMKAVWIKETTWETWKW